MLAVGGLDAARAELQVRDVQRPKGINEPFVMPPLFGLKAEKMLPVLCVLFSHFHYCLVCHSGAQHLEPS